MADGVGKEVQAPRLFRRVGFVGFAGHRAVPDKPALKAALKRELEECVAGLNGEVVGISSAAAGADLLFLEACGELGLRTVVILPFPRERFAEDFDDTEEWRRACEWIDAAAWCEVAAGNEPAPAAYHVVAREVLEVADRMLFVWNGQPARGLGGTGETVADAAQWKVPSRILDAATLEARWQEGSARGIADDPDFADLPAARSIAELFEKLDRRANIRAPRSRWFSAGTLSVNHLATLVAAMLAVFFVAGGKEIGATVKLVLALVAAGLPWFASRLRLHEGWVADRTRAELLRSLLASHEPASPLYPPALLLFEGHGAFLRSAALQLVPGRQGWQAARDHYLRVRIDNQIAFFESKGGKASRRMRVFGKVFWAASLGAMGFSGAAVIVNLLIRFHAISVPVWWSTWGMEFIPAILPGLAAWSMAMISVFEFKRRAGLYQQLVVTLGALRPKLADAKCASAVLAAIRQCERLLLNELWEWRGSRKK